MSPMFKTGTRHKSVDYQHVRLTRVVARILGNIIHKLFKYLSEILIFLMSSTVLELIIRASKT